MVALYRHNTLTAHTLTVECNRRGSLRIAKTINQILVRNESLGNPIAQKIHISDYCFSRDSKSQFALRSVQDKRMNHFDWFRKKGAYGFRF
jgi:hypothetical protein